MRHEANHTNSPNGAVSLLVTSLEHTWSTIGARHPDVPQAVLVVASGSEGKRVDLGHFAPYCWQVNGADRHGSPSISSGWRRRPDRRAPEAPSWLARFGSYRCGAWLLLARAASDPIETFGVDSVSRRTDLDKCRLDGVEHRVRAAGEELESPIAHR